jgi:hypothetical protein
LLGFAFRGQRHNLDDLLVKHKCSGGDIKDATGIGNDVTRGKLTEGSDKRESTENEELSGMCGGGILRDHLELGAKLFDVGSFKKSTVECFDCVLQSLCFAIRSERNTKKGDLSANAHDGLRDRNRIVRRISIGHKHNCDLLARLYKTGHGLQGRNEER